MFNAIASTVVQNNRRSGRRGRPWGVLDRPAPIKADQMMSHFHGKFKDRISRISSPGADLFRLPD